MANYTRRTVVRGAAWTVPVIAVAAPIPAFATSHEPPPPVIDFGGACGNTGATQKGCGSDKSLQVPLTLSNPGTEDIVFQITGMFTCNCASAPTGPGAPGSGIYSGIEGVFSTPGHAVADQDDCTNAAYSGCSGGLPGGSILVPAGTTNATYWIVSKSTQSSSTFSSRITWRLLSATGCTVLRSGEAATASAIAPANCNGAK